MGFAPGHKKLGGRQKGTPNNATIEGRELARRLLEDPKYQKSVRERLIKGEAPALEAQLWDRAFGRPRSDEPVSDGGPELAEVLERALERHRQGLGPQDPRGPRPIPRTPVHDEPKSSNAA